MKEKLTKNTILKFNLELLFSLLLLFHFNPIFSQKYELVTQPLYGYYDGGRGGNASFFLNDKSIAIDYNGKEIHFENEKYSENILMINPERFRSTLKTTKNNISFDEKGRHLFPDSLSLRYFRKDSIQVVSHNRKDGVLDYHGKIILPIIYDDIKGDYDERLVTKIGKKRQILNKFGNILFEFYDKYDNSNIYLEKNNGFVIIKDTNNRYYWFDKNLKLTEKIYERTINEKSGLFKSTYDLNSQVIIPPIYDHVIGCGSNIYIVSNGNNYALFNSNGSVLIDFYKYKSFGRFINGLMLVQNNENKFGYIDTLGRVKIPFIFDSATDFNSYKKVAVVKRNGKVSVIDLLGNNLISFKYDEINLGEDFLYVKTNNLWGLMNWNGKEITELKYEGISSLSSQKGISVVKKNSKYGLVNFRGKEILPLEYDFIQQYQGEGVIVHIKNKQGIVDKDGKFIVPAIYDEIQIFVNFGMYPKNYFVYSQNGKYGILKLKD